MTPKGHLNPVGNWRFQSRDTQVAVKIDSLSNPWQLLYGPAQITSYGNNNAGGLRVSGQYMDYTDSNRVPAFDVNNNFLEARVESSGGISFKNVGTSLSAAMFEPNIPDPAFTLPATVTPTRCVACAAVYWGRLIPDTGTGAIPTGVRMGGMIGVDFYDGSGRTGTPGQARLVEFTTEWKPVVMAFVLDPATSGPRQPYSPSAAGTWLTANPPPFV
jgi:hypothetical protein